MNILVVHQGFPGQYTHIVKALHNRGDKVTVISLNKPNVDILKCIRFIKYDVRRGNGRDTHELCSETETKTIRGESVGLIAEKLRSQGYEPDIILAHPGWGESLFLRTIWPKCPQLHYVEFAYNTEESDSDFEDVYNKKLTWVQKSKIRMKNANVYLNLDDMDWGVSPTEFQRATLPDWAKKKLSVIHDGIDTDWAKPDPDVKIQLRDGTTLTRENKVITFVNRTFEPYRGIHKMIEAIPSVQKAIPDVKIFLIGRDTPYVSYGEHRKDKKGWLNHLREIYKDKIDWSRVYTPGKISHDNLRRLFQLTSAHVYLSYPFVLSWSLLEAMSCGALIVGSDTEPVREVIKNGQNGLLVPFQDSQRLSDILIECLDRDIDDVAIREKARLTILKRFSLRECIKKQLALIDAISSRTIAGG